MGKTFRYILAIWVFLFIWQLLSLYFGPFILPSPYAVLRYFFLILQNPTFLNHIWTSFVRLIVGLAIGFFIAFPLGITMGYFKTLDKYMAPLIFLTYPIPKVLFLPVLLVLFGMGELPKMIIIALTTTYQILVVVRDSVRNLDPSYVVSFKTLWPYDPKRRSNFMLFLSLTRHVLIPKALPQAISSFRLASGTAVSVLFIAESFATDKGLGFVIMDAWGAMDLKRMWSAILAMSLMGALMFEFANFLEWSLCPWKRSKVK
jgi:NitT/TauT family transport system permease protein